MLTRRVVIHVAAVLLICAIALGVHSAASNVAPPLAADVRADSLLVVKSRHELVVFAHGMVAKRYAVALGRGGAGDKVREGDGKVPEGRFTIDEHVARSAFHRALHVSYPDSAHAARARAMGVPPGGHIMVHGLKNGLGIVGGLHRTMDWTAGCVALTDPEIEELFRAVPDGTPIVLAP